MGIYFIYFALIIIANTVGAISGMGGGVIIKPVLDGIGYHSLNNISFFSSVAVFTMAISSTYRQLRNGVQVKWLAAGLMSMGSILGGVAGEGLFNQLLTYFKQDGPVLLIQVILTVLSLIFVLFYTLKGKRTLNLTQLGYYFLIGSLLGAFSTLLGIGGGPINVTLLIICFGMKLKDATVYSIIIVFFSQLARLTAIGLSSGFESYDTSVLFVIIPAALLGGYIGGSLSGQISEEKVKTLFKWVVLLVIFLNLSNALKLLS